MSEMTKLFDFLGHTVRVVTIDNEPWFVATDVCEILAITATAGAGRIASYLDASERNTIRLMNGKRGSPLKAVISESGLYKVVMRSDKPQAKAFQDWVTKIVLSAIRKDGDYITALTTTTTTEKTMSSLEIAELTGKRHCDVMRDIRVMLESLGEGERKFACSYPGTYRPYPCYRLPRDLVFTLVSGYSIPLRHKVVTRWKAP